MVFFFANKKKVFLTLRRNWILVVFPTHPSHHSRGDDINGISLSANQAFRKGFSWPDALPKRQKKSNTPPPPNKAKSRLDIRPRPRIWHCQRWKNLGNFFFQKLLVLLPQKKKDEERFLSKFKVKKFWKKRSLRKQSKKAGNKMSFVAERRGWDIGGGGGGGMPSGRDAPDEGYPPLPP